MISPQHSKSIRCEINPRKVQFLVISPSNEWQDRVTSLLASSLQSQAYSQSIHPSASSATISNTVSLNDHHPPRHFQRQLDGDNVRRQRRRVDGVEGDGRGSSPLGATLVRSGSASPAYSPARTNTGYASGGGYASGYMGTSTDSDSEEDVVDAVGQLSINEDEQVRYHGKASGLYLLGINAKEEARNEGGIWQVTPHTCYISADVVGRQAFSQGAGLASASALTFHGYRSVLGYPFKQGSVECQHRTPSANVRNTLR